jgi:hypothetical protein
MSGLFAPHLHVENAGDFVAIQRKEQAEHKNGWFPAVPVLIFRQ